MTDDRGFAVLIVLWAAVLLALLGAQLIVFGREDAQLVRNMIDAERLQVETDGAVQQAIFQMLQPRSRRWRVDGTTHIIQLGSGTVSIRLEDEDSKVNVNLASEKLLRALLLQVGAAPATASSVAAAIVDWRTADPRRRRPLGAKTSDYIEAGLDYGPPGTDFRTMDELGAVLGMTPALLERLRPHVTVYSDSNLVGASSDPVIAAALGSQANISVPEDPGVVTVVAKGKANGGTNFEERVVIRLSPGTSGGYPFAILALDRTSSE